jgi:hypothetical protein
MQLFSVLDSTVTRRVKMFVSKFVKDACISRISLTTAIPMCRDFEKRGHLRAVEDKSSSRVTDVMPVDAFRQQTFATALTPARKDRATAFGTHPGPETVLTFARSLGWLVSAFHKTRNSSRRDWRAVILGASMILSIARRAATVDP